MDEPFHKVYELCRIKNTPGFRFIRNTINEDTNEEALSKYINTVRDSANTFTKFVNYRTNLNPDLNTHNVYGKTVYIPDYLRISFTRVRLMSHRLKIETGRWSRIPQEGRVCQCDRTSIQDESHVLLVCSISAHLRIEFSMLSFVSMNNLINSSDSYNMCKYIHKVLKLYY